MGTTIGPSAFFIGFVDAGLRVIGGHETILTDAWLAEFYWDEHHDASSHSIAVELHGEDNFLTNVIVFDYAKVGVLIDGAATILTGVHTWNGGGVGISINGTYDIQDRLLGCYLDYNYLAILHPTQIIVEQTFFLDTNAHLSPYVSDGAGVWRPGGSGPLIAATVFRDNTFSLGQAKSWGVNKTIVLDLPQGGFAPPGRPPFTKSQCRQVVIESSLSQETGTVISTRARLSLTHENATDWVLDFKDILLLPWIDEVMYSIALAPGTPLVQHAAEQPSGTAVRVRTSSPVTATVTVDVAQCV
jgi:hypothetical protein